MRLSTITSISFAVVARCAPFQVQNWIGELDDRSGVLRSLNPSSDPSFDFSPTDVFDQRNGANNHHTGDIAIRWRPEGQSAWQSLDTATQRDSAPTSINNTASLLTSSFDNVFADASDRVSIIREWTEQDGDLVLQAIISNVGTDSSIEIGSLGFPIEFNNILTGRLPVEARETCVFNDPYIGLHAGYVQVTRLTGTSPNLVVTPYGEHSKLEGWRFLDEDKGPPLEYQTHTFEGLYSWEIFTRAYAENEWNATTPWNEPTSVLLAPGENITSGLRFSVTEGVETIESTVASLGVPVAVGLPGYILPSDMDGHLYIDSAAEVAQVMAVPANALQIEPIAVNGASKWKAYKLTVLDIRERVRINIRYADGRTQSVHYFLTDSAPETLRRHARFLFSDQYFEGNDVFNRTPSIITYDYEARQKVEQDTRVWIAGIQDEGGAASYVAAAMKTAFDPIPEEVQKLELMAMQTMWQHMQYTEQTGEYPKYSVKRSLFYYEPEEVSGFEYLQGVDWSGWPSWNRFNASEVWRPYNYVWVSALYWSLYRAEKLQPGILTVSNASWYLDTAYRTVETCWSKKADGEPLVDFEDVGLMGETIWRELLADLQTEGLTAAHSSLNSIMQSRQQTWSQAADPFGSEAPWDSTGQEAVYLWSEYFGDANTVDRTLRSIRGYMPAIAHWAYHGNARRWWDFDVAGKLARIERQVHHYASPLNAVPLLDAYQHAADPSSELALHDLRVAYGGWFGALSNINRDGFGGQAFHSFPETLSWDAYSSDYGAGLTGHMVHSLTTLVEHPEFGLVAMGGNFEQTAEGVVVYPRDTVRRRIYVAPLGLRVGISAGQIAEFVYDADARSVKLQFSIESEQPGRTVEVDWEDTRGMGVGPQIEGRTIGDTFSVTLPASLVFA